MTHIMLALFLCAQDLSTPEKTFDAYVEAMRSLQRDMATKMRIDVELEVDRLADFLRTDALKASASKRLDETKRRVDEFLAQKSVFAIKGKTENADGTVDLRVTETSTSPGAGGEDRIRGSRLVLEKIGADWRLRDSFRDCMTCQATGECRICKGTGDVGGSPCFKCEGKKLCATCNGTKERQDRFDQMGVFFVVADADPKDSKDLSSAAAAARAYTDYYVRQWLVKTMRTRELVTKGMEKLRPIFKPDVFKTIDDSISKEVELGKKRFTDGHPKIGDLKESGDTATAILEIPAGWRGKDATKEQIALVKVGAEWRIDAVHSACPLCAGSGLCRDCKGTGKLDDKTDCDSCEGNKTCFLCEGAGFSKE